MKDNPSILIVDDEPINLKLAAETLNAFYQLHFARSGEDALDYLNRNHADLILLDITMGGMSGFEVAEALGKDENTANIPIIYLTGDNSAETIEKAFSIGAADYITKPFREKELLARVRNRIESEELKRDLHSSLQTNTHLLEIINSYVAYLKTNPHGVITEASQPFYEMFQCTEDLTGKNINILKSGKTPKNVYQELWNTIQLGQTYTNEIENRNFKEGSNWYRTTIIPDMDDNGTITSYIAFYINIDDKVYFKHESQTDFLTGLNNRSKFESELSEEQYRSQRYHHTYSIILVDIDHFKEVNDTFGHDTGDSLLKEFAKILSQNIRQSDILARWGGEEFIILCPNTDVKSAVALAETLRVKIEAYPFDVIGHKTASFGVAEFSRDCDEKTLFTRVDSALYQAKNQGRNQVISEW